MRFGRFCTSRLSASMTKQEMVDSVLERLVYFRLLINDDPEVETIIGLEVIQWYFYIPSPQRMMITQQRNPVVTRIRSQPNLYCRVTDISNDIFYTQRCLEACLFRGLILELQMIVFNQRRP